MTLSHQLAVIVWTSGLVGTIYAVLAYALVPDTRRPDFWERLDWHHRTFTYPRMWGCVAVACVLTLAALRWWQP